MSEGRNSASSQSKAATIVMNDGTVTQLTNTTTGVTLNKAAGVISCYTSTAGSGVMAKFTVTNSLVDANSVILANVCDYSAAVDGSKGEPGVFVDNITSGAFDLVIVNHDGAAHSLGGVVKVAFAIVA